MESPMEIWVLHWSYPYDNETNISLWDTHENALKFACQEIQDVIANEWDMSDETQKDFAQQFESNFSSQKWTDAIGVWEDYQDNHNSEYAQYWKVYSRPVLSE